MLDSENKPYLKVGTSEPPYYRTETFKDASGFNCTRQTLINPIESTQTKDYDLKNAGWAKKQEWQQISRKDVYFQEEGSLGFVKKKAIVLSIYSVEIKKGEQCFTCGHGEYLYLKNMPSSIYRRCFRCDLTAYYPLSDSLLKNGIYKLRSEKELSLAEAKRLIMDAGVFCADLTLKLELGI